MARENAEKANQAKSLFIANVSHEVRTPEHFESIDEQSDEQMIPCVQSTTDTNPPCIPAMIYHALVKGATDHEVSKLANCLTQLSNLNLQGQTIANQLQPYLNDYNMTGLLKALEKIAYE